MGSRETAEARLFEMRIGNSRFPGAMQRVALREALLRRTGIVSNAGVRYGPGSAAHQAAKSGPLRCVRGTEAGLPHTSSRAMLASRQPFNQGAREARDGQGSDAQQQGKEETEAGQEPEKGRRRAVAVRLRQVAAEPLSRQEGLTARLARRPSLAPPACRPRRGRCELLFPNCIAPADATA